VRNRDNSREGKYRVDEFVAKLKALKPGQSSDKDDFYKEMWRAEDYEGVATVQEIQESKKEVTGKAGITLFNNNVSNPLSGFLDVVADLAGIKIAEVLVTSENQAQYKSKLTGGKFPILETPEGTLFEANAIARHIGKLNPESGLCGKTLLDQAKVD
jgi:hypothetical protein